MNSQIKEWYLSYPKLSWKSTFEFLLNPRITENIKYDENGLAYFIKGYHEEFENQNYEEAMRNYEQGTELLDPLCILRLHEIYLGDKNFKIEFDEKKSLCYLLYGSLLNQFEVFNSYSFWSKCETLLKMLKSNHGLILEILKEPPVANFDWISAYYTAVFNFITKKEGFNEILPLFRALSFDKLKKSFFFLLNATFDFLAHAYSGDQSNSELLDFLNEVLGLATSDLLFDNLFWTFFSHLKLLKSEKEFGIIFNRRIESNAFWVWTLAFQTTLKNYYLGELLRFEEDFLEGNFEFKQNTLSWLNNYIGYCYEKGIGTSKNIEKSLELYEKDIFKMQRILFSRIRRIVCLKKINPEVRYRDLIEDVRDKTIERMKDYSRMDCYLYLSMVRSQLIEGMSITVFPL